MTSSVSQIQVTHLRKSYRDGAGHQLHVLNGVSLKIERGATVAIVGASGTGKSTFLQLLGGLDTPDEGQIVIDGQDLTELSSEALAHFRNEKIGFVFQFHHLLQDFNALENVMMPLRIERRSLKESRERALQLLAEVGLAERLYHRPSQLSGGEQQRVALARALANDPHILLADEPTGNLDQETGKHVFDLMLRLNRQRGITLLMITHNPELAQQMQHRYKMEQGLLSLLSFKN